MSETNQSFFNGRAVLVQMPSHVDHRGRLTHFEMTQFFVPICTFLVNGVPDGAVRGSHAHLRARQLMICLAGRVTVELCFQGEEVRVQLDRPTQGLLIEPGVWASQTYHNGAQLLVFASEPYDPSDYIQERV
jgi:hypothetical protein